MSIVLPWITVFLGFLLKAFLFWTRFCFLQDDYQKAVRNRTYSGDDDSSVTQHGKINSPRGRQICSRVGRRLGLTRVKIHFAGTDSPAVFTQALWTLFGGFTTLILSELFFGITEERIIWSSPLLL